MAEPDTGIEAERDEPHVSLATRLLDGLDRFHDHWYAPIVELALVFVALALLPTLVEVSVLGASLGTVLSVHILIIALVWAVAAQAWNLISGFGGQFSFGHAAFFGLGAYVPIILIREFAINPWVGMLVGGLVAGGYGLLIGGLCFRYRLRGNYFTLATLAFAELLRNVFINLPPLGGASGFVRPFPRVYASEYGLVAFQFRSERPYYYIILGFLAVVSVVALAVKQSQLGLHLSAIRDDEDAAMSIGIPTVRYKLVALSLSGFFTAWAGSFWAMYFASIRPNVVFDVLVNIDILLPAIVGGLGTVIGPIVGSLVLTGASELARDLVALPGLENFVYGLLLLAIVLYSPAGVVSWPARLLVLLRRFGPSLRRLATVFSPLARGDSTSSRPWLPIARTLWRELVGTGRFRSGRRAPPDTNRPGARNDNDGMEAANSPRPMIPNEDTNAPILKADGDDSLPPKSAPPNRLTFEDTVRLQATETRLWDVLSDPERLANCLPGVEDIRRKSDETYTCVITQSISGVTHLTLEMTSEFKLVERDEPDLAVIEGTAHDPSSATELAVLVAVRTAAVDDDSVDLAYTADVALRSHNASVSPAVLRPTIRDSLTRGFERLEATASNSDDGPP